MCLFAHLTADISSSPDIMGQHYPVFPLVCHLWSPRESLLGHVRRAIRNHGNCGILVRLCIQCNSGSPSEVQLFVFCLFVCCCLAKIVKVVRECQH